MPFYNYETIVDLWHYIWVMPYDLRDEWWEKLLKKDLTNFALDDGGDALFWMIASSSFNDYTLLGDIQIGYYLQRYYASQFGTNFEHVNILLPGPRRGRKAVKTFGASKTISRLFKGEILRKSIIRFLSQCSTPHHIGKQLLPRTLLALYYPPPHSPFPYPSRTP